MKATQEEIREDISFYLEKRQERIYGSMPEQYNEAKNKAESIYILLADSLSSELRILLNKYIDAKTSREVISNTCFYEQGFRDGTKSLIHLLK